MKTQETTKPSHAYGLVYYHNSPKH